MNNFCKCFRISPGPDLLLYQVVTLNAKYARDRFLRIQWFYAKELREAPELGRSLIPRRHWKKVNKVRGADGDKNSAEFSPHRALWTTVRILVSMLRNTVSYKWFSLKLLRDLISDLRRLWLPSGEWVKTGKVIC